MVDRDAARGFIRANGRLVERRLFAVISEDGSPDAVAAAVAAYRNPDGGFGHGLEPDKRTPHSQPLDVEIAFEYLATAGARADELVRSACDWLTTVTDSSGAVPVVLPSIAAGPRASHWDRTEYPAAVNPTAAIAAHGHALGVSHPWIDRATEYSFGALEADDCPAEAHTLLAMTRLIEAAPDRDRAAAGAEAVRSILPRASYLRLNPTSDGYGLTPLDFAPIPAATATAWFEPDVIERHLDALADRQEPDGGWPIDWEPLSDACGLEWRAIRTVHAVRTLAAYGRLDQ